MDRFIQIEFVDGTLIEVTSADEIPSLDAQKLAQIKRVSVSIRNPDPRPAIDLVDRCSSILHTTTSGTLRCGSCGVTKPIMLADVKQYSQVDWPIHCGLPMISDWVVGTAQ